MRAKNAKGSKAAQSATTGQKVGRGSPPKHQQFKKGVSGNPNGRPKGSKNLATLISEAAYDQVTITTKSGETKKLSRIQATTLQLANKAAQGDPKAMLNFMNWVDEVETRAANARPAEIAISEADLKVIQAVHERMKLCERPLA
jgi:hypothetical protein